MRKAKYAIAWFLDWIVDVRILRHRWHRYCEWVEALWWKWDVANGPENPES